MAIKEESSQRMVITPSTLDWLWGSFFLLVLVGISILVGIVLFSEGISLWVALVLGVSFALGLHVLGRVAIHGKKCVIDKTTQNVVLEDRYLLFSSHRRTIPFSGVRYVRLSFVWTPDVAKWKVSICTSDEEFEVGEGRHLASAISRFIGVELVDKS